MDLVLQFLYRVDYKVPDRLINKLLITHAQVYALAEMYCIDSLKERALTKFDEVLDAEGDPFSRCADLADAIDIAFTTTVGSDRALRESISIHLAYRTELLEDEHIGPVVERIPGLLISLMRKLKTKSLRLLRDNTKLTLAAKEKSGEATNTSVAAAAAPAVTRSTSDQETTPYRQKSRGTSYRDLLLLQVGFFCAVAATFGAVALSLATGRLHFARLAHGDHGQRGPAIEVWPPL